jgi:hypothetical protein
MQFLDRNNLQEFNKSRNKIMNAKTTMVLWYLGLSVPFSSQEGVIRFENTY